MKLATINNAYKEDAKQVLEDAIKEEFDTVVVLGFHKEDNLFSIKASGMQDRLVILGALEEAKSNIILGGYVTGE
jgi:hypothetical protein